MTTKRDLRRVLDGLYAAMRAAALAHDHAHITGLRPDASKRQREDATYDVRDRERDLEKARNLLIDTIEVYLLAPKDKP